MKALNSCLGARISVLRHAAGWSLAQLAEATGRSTFQIRNYETGTAEIEAAFVWQISKALDVPVQTLFDPARPPHESRSFIETDDEPGSEPVSGLRRAI